MEHQFTAYIVISLGLSLIMSFRTEEKAMLFVILFWILAQPVLTTKYTIDLPGLPFDLQPNRIMLFVMLYFFVYTPRDGAGNSIQLQNKPRFEYWMYIYLAFVFIALLVNYDRIEPKKFVAVPAQILLFVLFYHCLKKRSTNAVLEAILRTVLLLGIVCSVIAIYQLVIDSSFLKLRSPRFAFGGFSRSTAIFGAEYDLGCVIILATIILLAKYQNRPVAYWVFPLLLAGLITTFHRLSWVIALVCMIIYLIYFDRNRYVRASVFFLSMLMGIAAISHIASPDIFFGDVGRKKIVNEFQRDRIVTGSKTLKNRFQHFSAVGVIILKNPLGVGDYYNVVSAAYRGHQSTIGAVHNGFLYVGVNYGFLAMFAFFGLVISMLRYFWNQIDRVNLVTVCPFFSVLIWTLSNLTNGLASFRTYFVLLMAIVCGSFMSLYSERERKGNEL